MLLFCVCLLIGNAIISGATEDCIGNLAQVPSDSQRDQQRMLVEGFNSLVACLQGIGKTQLISIQVIQKCTIVYHTGLVHIGRTGLF